MSRSEKVRNLIRLSQNSGYSLSFERLNLRCLLEREKASFRYRGASLLDCLKNGYFREDVCKRIHHSHLGKEELAV